MPAKQALKHTCQSLHSTCVWMKLLDIHGDVVSIELLFVAEGLEVGLDRERDDCRGIVGEILLEGLGVYGGCHVGWVGVFCDWESGVFMEEEGWVLELEL